MDNRLVVKSIDGDDITIDVIDIIEDTETNNSYICYTVGDLTDIFVSRLIEKDSTYSLENISEEEKEMVEAIMSENIEE